MEGGGLGDLVTLGPKESRNTVVGHQKCRGIADRPQHDLTIQSIYTLFPADFRAAVAAWLGRGAAGKHPRRGDGDLERRVGIGGTGPFFRLRPKKRSTVADTMTIGTVWRWLDLPGR